MSLEQSDQATALGEHLRATLSAMSSATGVTPVKPEDHLVLPVQLHPVGAPEAISSHALLDSGATSNFIDRAFCQRHRLQVIQKAQPYKLWVIDGRPIKSGTVSHSVVMSMSVGTHRFTINLDVTALGSYPVVLGTPWLRRFNPTINWKRNQVTVSEDSSHSVKELPLVPASASPQIALLDATAYDTAVSLPGSTSGVLFADLQSRNLSAATSSASVPGDGNIQDPVDYVVALQQVVPAQYHDLLAAFSKSKADALPPHRP